jgi:hypothetical protein
MRLAGFLAAALVVLVMVGPEAPVTAGLPAYRMWLACSLSKQAPPSHSCKKGSAKAAFFKSRLKTVHYKICVRYPNGTRLCAASQLASKGVVASNRITSTLIGQHHVTWSVAGKKVGTWSFQVTR